MPDLYELHHVGGPEDGLVCLSPRRCLWTRDSRGVVYVADPEEEWVDDDTRRITPRHRPDGRVPGEAGGPADA